MLQFYSSLQLSWKLAPSKWRNILGKILLFFNKFFPIIIFFFLQQLKNTIKIINMKNNYMNQLLRLPLLKYTHRKKIRMLKKNKQTNKSNNNKKENSTILPPQEKIGLLQHPRQRSPWQQSRNKSRHSCRKDLHPRGHSYPRFSSFLCKSNLTKS